MKYEAIVLAAGQGKRMQSTHNKILLHLRGKPVIVYAIEAFIKDPACQHVVLVAQADEIQTMQKIQARYFKKYREQITVVAGGAERQDSVYEGLQAVRNLTGYVMIHDGARPFVTHTQLKSLSKKVQINQAAILGVPVKDTIKKVTDGQVLETIPRDCLWQIQTPQAFVAEELVKVHQLAKKEGFLGTDDASLMEKYSERDVSMVLGSYENIKLTTPDDMLIGEAIIQRRVKNN